MGWTAPAFDQRLSHSVLKMTCCVSAMVGELITTAVGRSPWLSEIIASFGG